MATLVVAGAAGTAVAADLATAPSGSALYGPTKSVAVATRNLDIGARLTPSDLEWRDVPQAAVAATALTEAVASTEAGVRAEPVEVGSDWLGRTVSAPIMQGEPIVTGRLAPAGLIGAAAATAAGRHAVAIPIDTRTPALALGQQVDLYTTPLPRQGEGLGPSGGGDSKASGATADRRTSDTGADRLAAGATVVAVDDLRATVAVADADLPRVSAGLIEGTIVVALKGWP